MEARQNSVEALSLARTSLRRTAPLPAAPQIVLQRLQVAFVASDGRQELGVDEGGLRAEFFSLLWEELALGHCVEGKPLFRSVSEAGTSLLPNSEACLRLAGRPWHPISISAASPAARRMVQARRSCPTAVPPLPRPCPG